MPGTPEMSGIVPIADESLKPHGAISVVTHKYLHRAVPAGPGVVLQVAASGTRPLVCPMTCHG